MKQATLGKTSSCYIYMIEAYHQSKKQILAFIGMLGAVWGGINSLFAQDVSRCVFSVFALIGVVYAILIFRYWYYRIAKGRMSVEIFQKRNITLLRDGYPENMEKLLHELPQTELDDFAFIMGIDRTGELSISSKGGVVRAVLQHLDNCYVCNDGQRPSDAAQQQLNESLSKHQYVDPVNKLDYGTCIGINLNIHQKDEPDAQRIPCHLIFIANSRKDDPKDKNNSEALNDDNMSNIIIPKVFNYLLKYNKFRGAMIGVMGTNAMRQPYQVIFSQTINQFARICYKDKQNPLLKLYISIREVDYINWDMTLSQLGDYVRQCARYYKV